ncbi:MAG: prepilin peptidase [Alphaproteobacteria bacterium]|nr:prepilin peptidase [Alphaproteobacteria bacterium]
MTPDLPPPFGIAWFRFALGFAVGAVLGSFGTMLAYRVPRRLSIVWPGSHCPSCRTPLTIADLVPLLSFIAHRGKCAHCGARIGMRYFYIELACAVAGGIIALIARP